LKIVLILFLGILALNALVILAVAGILVADRWKTKRRKGNGDAEAHAS
jgi:hypothetical protein